MTSCVFLLITLREKASLVRKRQFTTGPIVIDDKNSQTFHTIKLNYKRIKCMVCLFIYFCINYSTRSQIAQTNPLNISHHPVTDYFLITNLFSFLFHRLYRYSCGFCHTDKNSHCVTNLRQ